MYAKFKTITKMEPLQDGGAESVLAKLAQLKEQQAQLRQVLLLLLLTNLQSQQSYPHSLLLYNLFD